MIINNILVIALLAITWASGYLLYQLKRLEQLTENLFTRQVVTSRSWPKVSIIVPIHNEQNHLLQAMKSLISLNYPDYEIIAVNDRSTDNSYAMLEILADQCPVLKLITIDQVPPGWLGKTHALQTGLFHAQGSYILFTDADVIFLPDLLTKAMDYILVEELGHLTLAPQLDLLQYTMKILMPFQAYIMMAATMPWRTLTNRSKQALGIGAFNCVSRQALYTIGDMKNLALNPIDDIGLAKRLKQFSIKQGFANPKHLLHLSWYDNISSLALGFEKNIFAFFNYSLAYAFIALICFLSFIFLPFITLLTANYLCLIISIFSISISLISVMTICHQLLVPKYYAWLYPLTALVTLYVGLRAVTLCLFRRGIYWGGLFFSLAELKAFYKCHK